MKTLCERYVELGSFIWRTARNCFRTEVGNPYEAGQSKSMVTAFIQGVFRVGAGLLYGYVWVLLVMLGLMFFILAGTVVFMLFMAVQVIEWIIDIGQYKATESSPTDPQNLGKPDLPICNAPSDFKRKSRP